LFKEYKGAERSGLEKRFIIPISLQTDEKEPKKALTDNEKSYFFDRL
jgi:hypothetical protein